MTRPDFTDARKLELDGDYWSEFSIENIGGAVRLTVLVSLQRVILSHQTIVLDDDQVDQLRAWLQS